MADISTLTSVPSVEQLVSSYSAKERKPVKALETKKTALSEKSAVLTDLKSKLKSLRTRVKGFTDVGAAAKLAAKSAVSSDTSIFTVEADATAETGINTLFVSRIASRDIAVSSVINKSPTTIAKTFFGTQQEFTVQIGSDTRTTISINFDNRTETNEEVLSRIAEAINENVDDVSVNVITTKKNKARLTIVASNTGSENAISLSDVNNSQLLQTLGFISENGDERRSAEKSQGGYITSDAESLDSLFELNGIEIISSSNTITGVLEGVTIQLRKAQQPGSSPETFTISIDADAIIEQIDEFIKEYNDVIKFLNEKTSVDLSTNERGALASNFIYSRLRLSLRELVSQNVSGVQSGSPSNITEIGIKIDTKGTLSIDDEDELEDAIADSPDAVIDLFTGELGIAAQLTDLLESYTLTGRVIDKDISSIRRQTTTVNRQISRFESSFRLVEENLRQKFTQLQRSLTLLQSQQAALQRFGFSSNTLFQFGSISNTGLLEQNRIQF